MVRGTEKFRVKIAVKSGRWLSSLLWTVLDCLGGGQERSGRVPAEICGGKVTAVQ